MLEINRVFCPTDSHRDLKAIATEATQLDKLIPTEDRMARRIKMVVRVEANTRGSLSSPERSTPIR
jgi:hypothetical protein